MWEVRKIQNQDIIMRKVGKWFIIIGIAGVLSILFVEWSRWNIISFFYMKIIIEVLQRIYHWIRTETKTNQYDVEKIMLILTIMTFIFVMGCLV